MATSPGKVVDSTASSSPSTSSLCILITITCVHPVVQEYNPRSGLAQSAMVAAYCTYLIVSAVGNHTHVNAACNPLRQGGGSADGTRKAAIWLGGLFTFIAIAYSTTRAATQSRALVGDKKGRVRLDGSDSFNNPSELAYVSTQPGRTESPRYQALLAAVEAGAIPASALQEDWDDEEEELGESRDDERSGTRYNVSCTRGVVMLALIS